MTPQVASAAAAATAATAATAAAATAAPGATAATADKPAAAGPTESASPAGQSRRILRRRIGVRQALANGLTLTWRNVMQLKHSPEKLMDVTLMPIVFLVLFLYVFGGVVAGSTHAYLEQLLPGMIAQMAMFATMGLGTALCEDIHKGVFDRFRSLPIARSAPLVGAVLGDTVRFCVVMGVLTGFGSALGFRFHAGPLAIAAAYGLAYLFYLAVCWISALIGLVAPSRRPCRASPSSGRCRWCLAAASCWPIPAPCRAGYRPGSRSTPSPTWPTRSGRSRWAGRPARTCSSHWPGRPGSPSWPSRWRCGCTADACKT